MRCPGVTRNCGSSPPTSCGAFPGYFHVLEHSTTQHCHTANTPTAEALCQVTWLSKQYLRFANSSMHLGGCATVSSDMGREPRDTSVTERAIKWRASRRPIYIFCRRCGPQWPKIEYRLATFLVASILPLHNANALHDALQGLPVLTFSKKCNSYQGTCMSMHWLSLNRETTKTNLC